MYPTSKRILDQTELQAGEQMEATAAPDLSEAHELEILVMVHTAATAVDGAESPQLLVKHATTRDEQYYVDFPTPIAVDLTQVGPTWIHVPYFTRYVGWFQTGTFESAPVVSLEAMAKG